MMDNERRADLGYDAVYEAAMQTNVHTQEDTATAITDVLAYIAHLCDRCGLTPEQEFRNGLQSYYGDFEDGPGAEPEWDHTIPLAEQVAWPPPYGLG